MSNPTPTVTVTETPLAKNAKPLTVTVCARLWDMITELRSAVASTYNVEIVYPEDGTGPITSRTITPSSVAITMKGEWVIRGVRVDTGEQRCYRLDRMHGYNVIA